MSLQTTGGKDELKIVCIHKSQRTSQDGTENVKTHNRTTQKLRKLSIILFIFTVKLSFSLLLQLSSQTVSCSNIITFGYSQIVLRKYTSRCTYHVSTRHYRNGCIKFNAYYLIHTRSPQSLHNDATICFDSCINVLLYERDQSYVNSKRI